MAREAAAPSCVAVLLAAFSAQAQTEGVRKRWRTGQGEHFEVSSPEPIARVARRLLSVARPARDKLRPLPCSVTRLFMRAPEDLPVLSDFEDLLTILTTHQHAPVNHRRHRDSL